MVVVGRVRRPVHFQPFYFPLSCPIPGGVTSGLNLHLMVKKLELLDEGCEWREQASEATQLATVS